MTYRVDVRPREPQDLTLAGGEPEGEGVEGRLRRLLEGADGDGD
jgi:hypothetical protein